MKKHSLIWLVAVGVVPLGCTLAPKYSRPAAPVPAQWPQGPAYQAPTTNAPSVADVGWQQFFGDPKLRNVISVALTNNRDLRLSILNVERARAMYGVQRAELLPSIDATGAASRQRVPADLSSSGHRQTVSRYDVNLGVAAWEIDFFGRIRSFKERALQEYLATEQAQRSAQILLVSSVANAYLTLAADLESLRLAETTLKSQQGSYDIIKRRHELGLAPELDLFRAQTQVETARADIARYTRLAALDENALNLLAGSPVPREWLPVELAAVTPPSDLNAGLRSDVLLLRPDVLQAENLLRAANADIGAARAAFFPRISLTAAIGTASGELSGLFKAGSGTWSYAPQIVMPVFDARTWSAHRAAKVQQKIAVTQYENSIQVAFREVADALATRGTIDLQVDAQAALVKAVGETYRLSSSRYEKGLDSYLSVLDAQRALYTAEQGLVSARLAKTASQVRLYAVLGGGTQDNSAFAPPATLMKGGKR